MSLYNKYCIDTTGMTGNLGLFNQFQDTIHRKYRRFPRSSSNDKDSATTEPVVSKPIQLLRNLDSEIRSMISSRKSKLNQSGGSPDDKTVVPPGVTSDSNLSEVEKDEKETVSVDNTEKDDKDYKDDKVVDVPEKDTDVKRVDTPETVVATGETSDAKPTTSPEELSRRMDELTRLLKDQMAKPAMPSVSSMSVPSIGMPTLPSMQIPQVSIPTLNDAKSALDSAKTFLNVGSFSTDAVKDTFMKGMGLLGEAVDKYTRWADEYRQREEKLKRDTETNPEYAKVRADSAMASSTPPKRAINPIKYVPIDVQRNARIPPTAQLELPAMTEVVRLQNEIYGPRGKPTEQEQPRSMGPMGPFYRDPIIASAEDNPSAGIVKPPEPVVTEPVQKSQTENGEGLININPNQVFNLSLGFIVAQIGAVAYYAIKSL
jgi:hypothetical protein